MEYIEKNHFNFLLKKGCIPYLHFHFKMIKSVVLLLLLWEVLIQISDNYYCEIKQFI